MLIAKSDQLINIVTKLAEDVHILKSEKGVPVVTTSPAAATPPVPATSPAATTPSVTATPPPATRVLVDATPPLSATPPTCDSPRYRTLPDPEAEPGPGDAVLTFFFESFRIIQIQLLFQTQFKYSMKINIRKYHFNIKEAHHLIAKHFFSFDVAFHAHLVHFPPLYNATLLAVFNIQIFTKHNQSSIFIIVFVQNELKNFMYACDEALLIFRVTLMMTLIHCGTCLHICSLGTCMMIKTTR